MTGPRAGCIKERTQWLNCFCSCMCSSRTDLETAGAGGRGRLCLSDVSPAVGNTDTLWLKRELHLCHRLNCKCTTGVKQFPSENAVLVSNWCYCWDQNSINFDRCKEAVCLALSQSRVIFIGSHHKVSCPMHWWVWCRISWVTPPLLYTVLFFADARWISYCPCHRVSPIQILGSVKWQTSCFVTFGKKQSEISPDELQGFRSNPFTLFWIPHLKNSLKCLVN